MNGDEVSPRQSPPEEARPGFLAYKNGSGRSNVRAYQIEPESITVEFRDGSRYLYTADSVGPLNLYTMKQLAAAGVGLNSFINKYVRKMYVSKG